MHEEPKAWQSEREALGQQALRVLSAPVNADRYQRMLVFLAVGDPWISAQSPLGLDCMSAWGRCLRSCLLGLSTRHGFRFCPKNPRVPTDRMQAP